MVDEVLKCHDPIEPVAPKICEPICPKVNVENGTYGSVTIVDGCIVDAQDCHLPVYTPPVCCDGGDGGGGGGGTTTELGLLADGCNLLKKTGSDYYVKPVFANTSSVTWSGCGTTSSPFSATAITSSDGVIINGTSCIQASYNGTAWIVGHTPNGLASGVYDGITIDQCGHITNVDIPLGDDLTAKGGSAIVITGNEISIADSPAQGVYQLGNTSITIDGEGRVIGITTVAIPAGTFTTVDGKIVTYDQSGVITSVV